VRSWRAVASGWRAVAGVGESAARGVGGGVGGWRAARERRGRGDTRRRAFYSARGVNYFVAAAQYLCAICHVTFAQRRWHFCVAEMTRAGIWGWR